LKDVGFLFKNVALELKKNKKSSVREYDPNIPHLKLPFAGDGIVSEKLFTT